MKRISALLLFLLVNLCVSEALSQVETDASLSNAQRYLDAAQAYANVMLQHGRDTYGRQKTPLLVDGLHANTLEPATWQHDGETWILCNFASQQPALRLLDGLTAMTGDEVYGQAAEEISEYALEHLVTPNGLLYWGGHMAWDLAGDRPVGQYDDIHEMKGHQPYYELLYRVNPGATRSLLETVWGSHFLDWQRLDYNRHGSVKKPRPARWEHAFDADTAVPFPAVGGNLSFCNVTPSLAHAGISLAMLEDHANALIWTRRLLYRWQQARDPETGLCGGQLSYREHDRAQDALGHVHPDINEAKIVASYHQTSRYHHLPLVQLQAATMLQTIGGKHEQLAQQLVDWAADDLRIYVRQCYDSESGKFVARMTDGTALRWQEAKSDYYVPSSFAPKPPDGNIAWAYAMAYRLTGDRALGEMARTLTTQLLQAGDSTEWRLIYAQLELYQADRSAQSLRVACEVADRLLKWQSSTGLFPRPGREYARLGDEVPLALLHLAAAIQERQSSLPQPMFDNRFFHCEYHSSLDEHQQKRADKRTYDNYVYFGN